MELTSPTSVPFPLDPCKSLYLSGPSGSGKSTWLSALLHNKKVMFTVDPTDILYCYGIWSDSYGALERDIENLHTYEGLPNLEYIENFAKSTSSPHKILIMDDLLSEICKNSWTEKLFTMCSHHMKLTVIFVSQNLFPQSKNMRTIAVNTSYIILFRNPRDQQQIGVLGTQLGARKTLLDAYGDATLKPYNYLFIDLTATCKQEYKFRTGIFPDEECIIYT